MATLYRPLRRRTRLRVTAPTFQAALPTRALSFKRTPTAVTPALPTATLPTRALSLGTQRQHLLQRLMNAVDKLIVDENKLYRSTSGYMRLDRVQHWALLAAVRQDTAELRNAKYNFDLYIRRAAARTAGPAPSLSGRPLRSAPLRKKKAWDVPLRLPTTTPTFRPAAPRARLRPRVRVTAPRAVSRLPAAAPIPGALTARARQEAAIQRQRDYDVARYIAAAKHLTQMLDHLDATGSRGVPLMRGGLTSADWIDGLTMKGEDPRIWRSPDGFVFRGNREHYMRALLRNIRTQVTAVSSLDPERRAGVRSLSDVTYSETSPLVWLALGLAAAYVVYEGAMSVS